MDTSIEHQNLTNQKELRKKLLQTLAQYLDGMTKNEMIVQSGIGNEVIDYIVRTLLDQYTVHLIVDEHYEVRYVFDLNNPKHTDFSRLLRPFYQLLNYVGYLVVFVLAILMALVWTLMALPLMASILGIYLGVGLFQVFFNQGLATGAKEFLIYWMGRPEKKDPLEDEKEVLYFLSQRAYCFSLAEIVAHMNWDYQKASNEALGFLINYGGEIIVDEEGMILYDFSNLKNQSGIIPPPKAQAYVYKAPILTDDEKVDVFSFKKWDFEVYKARKIYLLNYFNTGVVVLSTLFLSIILYRYFSGADPIPMINSEELSKMSEYDIEQRTHLLYTMSIGFLITLLFDVMLVVQWYLKKHTDKMKELLKRRGLFIQYILEDLHKNQWIFAKNQLIDKINTLHLDKKVRNEKSENILANYALAFEAEPEVQDDGSLGYHFEKMYRELKAIEKYRLK